MSDEFSPLPLIPLHYTSNYDLQLTSLLSETGLNIQEAHAFSTLDGYSLDVFVVGGWPTEVLSLFFLYLFYWIDLLKINWKEN